MIDTSVFTANDAYVSDIIYPRSPREKMAEWIYLPRLLDKIRLAEAGKLHADYQPNYLHKGFDAKWLETTGLDAEEFVANVCEKASTDSKVSLPQNAQCLSTKTTAHISDGKVLRSAVSSSGYNNGRSGGGSMSAQSGYAHVSTNT